MRTPTLSLLILALCVGRIAAKCGIDNFDFSSLTIQGGTGTKDYSVGPVQTQTYDFNVCKASTLQNTQCNAVGATICQIDSAGTGYWLGKEPGTWSYITPGDPTQGVMVSYEGQVGCSQARAAQIKFICGTARVGALMETPMVGNPSCGYVITFPTNLACPGNNNGNVTVTYKLSGGWIFFIIVMVIIPVYIAVGCGWNYYKHRDSSWKEKCPQWGFWSLIPALVKDGCIYSWRKTAELFRRCFGGGGGSSAGESYESVK